GQGSGVLRAVRVRGTLLRRWEFLVAVREVVDQAAMPGLPRIEPYFKTEPPVGVDRARRMLARRDRDRAGEVAVDVGGGEALLVFRPVRLDPAAPHDAI